MSPNSYFQMEKLDELLKGWRLFALVFLVKGLVFLSAVLSLEADSWFLCRLGLRKLLGIGNTGICFSSKA